MEQLQTIRKKIDNVGQLHSVVKTMKSMAAVNIHHFQRAAESIVDYSRTVELGLQVVLQDIPDEQLEAIGAGSRRLGVIVFGSAHGMVGQFNQIVASYTLEMLNRMEAPPEDRTVLALGERVATSLEGSGQPVDEYQPIAGSLADVVPRINAVLDTIQTWREVQDIERIVLFHNRPTSRASYDSTVVSLLPIKPDWLRALRRREWPSRTIPSYTMEWRPLFSALVRQFFFVSLYRAFVESQASENSSRLAAMQSAERNIEDRLDDLQSQFHRQRQNAITAELLDIVSGYTALEE